MEQDERLRGQIGSVTKCTGVSPGYFEVLEAAQYLDTAEVGRVLKWFKDRYMKFGIDEDPTDWVCERLEETTRMKLAPKQMPEEYKEKIFSVIQWLNRECEFDLYINFNNVMPLAYDVSYGVVQMILQRVYDLVHLVGNEEVRKDPTEYIRFALTRWREDRARAEKWVRWQNTKGGLKDYLPKYGMFQLWKEYDRTDFWRIISENEDKLPEQEDPFRFLKRKLELPAEIGRASVEYFDDAVDVRAVEEAAEGMSLEEVKEALRQAVARRWEVDSDPTGFIIAILKEVREAENADEMALEEEAQFAGRSR